MTIATAMEFYRGDAPEVLVISWDAVDDHGLYRRVAVCGHDLSVRFANRVVCALLESPVHRLMSGSTDVIRYLGRRSGTTFMTPTQYATYGDGLVILVGRPDTKRWWRNFLQDRDIDVLVAGRWRDMVGRAVIAADEPDVIAPLLDAYLQRFPKAARLLETVPSGSARDQAVVVWCRPR